MAARIGIIASLSQLKMAGKDFNFVKNLLCFASFNRIIDLFCVTYYFQIILVKTFQFFTQMLFYLL
jgi:hypothetical protein